MFFKRNKTIKQCQKAIESVQTVLNDTQFKDCIDYIEHNEWGLALKFAIDWILEEDKKISESMFSEFKKAYDVMGLESDKYILSFKKQILIKDVFSGGYWDKPNVQQDEQGKKFGDHYLCPCCGYPTLSYRGGFGMCPICWWEDDGQDDHDADEVFGGPNGLDSLTSAREKFKTSWKSTEKQEVLGKFEKIYITKGKKEKKLLWIEINDAIKKLR